MSGFFAKLTNYSPPPEDLRRLNPVQRYMQKGSLEWSDYGWLLLLVGIYWFARPAIQNFVRRTGGRDLVLEGEQETEEYKQRRAQAALAADELRGTTRLQKRQEDAQTMGDLLDTGIVRDVAKKDVAKTTGVDVDEVTTVSRKQEKKKPKKGVSFAEEKNEEDKTLDWEDENKFDPRNIAEGDKRTPGQSASITQWLDKWDQLEE